DRGEERGFCSANNQCLGCGEANRERVDAGGADAGTVCPVASPVCETTSGRCHECLVSTDCKDATKPICHEKKCVPCTMAGMPPDPNACKNKSATLPACLTNGQCGECNGPAECPRLDAAGCFENKCVACTKDSDCKDKGAQVCITDVDGKAGRCATVEETIFVAPPTGTCPTGPAGGNGSAATPFCRVSDAIAMVSPTRRVVVLKGAGASTLDPIIVSSASPMALHIIGVADANGVRPIISPGGLPGIHVNAGVEVRVRNVTINGGDRVGVAAEGNATIRLNRCIVTNNMGGGFSATQGAGFDVSNTVFANNGAALIGAVTFSGAYLGTPMGNRTRRFRFNTIVNHAMGPGVVCADNATDVSGLLTYMNSIGDVVQCRVTNCMISGNPQFNATRPYHLTQGSPAVNKVPRASAPPDDLDGEARTDADSDCGADEFQP
ncbi:MAG TPA: right-handed parallel beta-helix repeat-containing protein, partial [Polyangia bacterium]